MTVLTSRSRLLSGAALGLGLTMVGTSPAQAACVVTANSVTCGTTTTTDTTNAGVATTTAVDRHYPSNTSAGAYTVTVSTGAIVDGYGLSTTNTVPGANTLTVANNGAVQINAGNTATQGGASALQVNAAGATAVSYTGNGSVTNLGTTGNGLYFVMGGTGALTAAVGGNVTSAAGVGDASGNAIAVSSIGASGNITLTTATGTTLRGDQSGIWVNAANAVGTSAISVTNTAAIASRTGALNTLDYGIVATSAGLGAVTVVNNGTIGATTDRTTIAGISATITNPLSAAALSVSGSGNIFTSGTGIIAANAGTGTTTVNYTGAINTTGATGVSVTGGTGLTTVTAGPVTAATDAVVVTSTGPQAITLNGAVTGTAGSGLVSTTSSTSTTPAARSITVASGATVTGGTQAILLNGTATTTLSNSGTIGALSGGLATGLAINDAGGGASTITNATGGVINGRVSLGAGDDSLVNNALWRVQGALDFGAGADRLTNSATGTITLTGDTSLVGLESFGTAAQTTPANSGATNSGTINLATFTLTGIAGQRLTNAAGGNITTSGNATIAGFTGITNAGTLTLGAGTLTVPAGPFVNSGSVIARSGASTITGQVTAPLPGATANTTAFTNTGSLLLNDTDTNDVLTINSAFAASGGSTLSINAAATTADRLVINGNVTGTTNVVVTPIAGTVGFDQTGILIVDVTGAFTAPSNAFATTSALNTLINYRVEQRGQDFFLVTAPSAGAFAPVMLGNLVLDNWYTGQEAFSAMAAARGGQDAGTFSIWAQPLYASERYGDRLAQFNQNGVNYVIPLRQRVTRQGIQGGVDFGMGFARVGITGGYQQAEFDSGVPTQPVTGVTPLIVNGSQADGWNIGAYAMAGGPVGIYANGLIKYDSNDIDLNGGAFEDLGVNTKGNSFGVDGEVGYRSSATGFSLEALAGLSYVNSDIDGFDVSGINYEYDSIDSLRGRLGARAVFNQFERLFVGAKILHEFSGDTDLILDSVADASIRNKGRTTWGRLEAGIGGSPGMPFNISAWQNVGEVKGWGITGGVRLNFGGSAPVVEEVAPPPPPPPPPAAEPAPEPAPPPPPPPAPEPGERG